jgi:aminoglycoside phosphotransferase (APT) family kinase protein
LAAEPGLWRARNPCIAHAHLTSTGRAVVVLAVADEPPCAVIKMPLTAEASRGHERESRVLAALHADERLGEWRRLVPLPLAAATLLGQPYRMDSALTGRAIRGRVRDEATPTPVLESAAEAIHFLHRTTATAASCDSSLGERWIDAPLDDLARNSARCYPRFASRLERLRAELHGAVRGRPFATSWIHGDYWLGNLLLSPGGSTIEGIVDWDAAAPGELAIHDVLHLLFYTRRMRTGQELGQLVRRQLRGGGWSPEERRLLDRYGAWCHDGSLSGRHAVLLYWLRHAAFHTRQQGRPRNYRHRLWEIRNVHSVLSAL